METKRSIPSGSTIPMLRFSGIIQNTPGEEPSLMLQIANGMAPDYPGRVASRSFPQIGLCVAWQETADDDAPVWNDRQDRWLVWGGEVYQDGITAVRQSGGTTGDTSAWLLRQYEKQGPQFLKELNGCFSGLLVDLRENKALLFNDRYGLKRVYIHENQTGLFFSSEAKRLLQCLPEVRSIDEKSLGEWLSCGCVLQNRTLFKKISILSGAAAWVFSPRQPVQKTVYFRPEEWIEQTPLEPEGYYQALRETFPKVLKRYISGSRPLGMSLTAGLDGRMVMAWAGAGLGELPCYTFNGMFRDCADLRIARQVAEACGQPHQTILIGNEFLKEFPRLAQEAISASDGSMDVTGAAELYANRLAGRIAPVRLTGNYGSEILRGNIAFRPAPLADEFFAPELRRSAAEAALTYHSERRVGTLPFIAFKQVPWHHYSRWSIEQSQLTVRSPFLDNDLVRLAFRAPRESAGSLASSLRLIAEGHPGLGRIPTDRGITGSTAPLRNKVRCAYHEFWAKGEYAWDYGMPHWLARLSRALAPFRFEKLFLGRQKFCHFRVWYRDHLSSFVRDRMLDSHSLNRPYLQPAAVRSAVEKHIRGTHNYTREIHKLLSLELIHRTFIDRNSAP